MVSPLWSSREANVTLTRLGLEYMLRAEGTFIGHWGFVGHFRAAVLFYIFVRFFFVVM